ncbi:hypothetical protein [Komagataeibacter xylinus]|uniref:hypothetical protein n=1 Tax=Komagataeibacter xylinus TaxID=28448 RepID=UPI00280AE253|nr:hypothetical protein [Komagataeibacter xylinus]
MSANQSSRGKISRQFSGTTGTPVDRFVAGNQPHDEWIYLSARFPTGIRRGTIAQQSNETQQFVADWWFLSNYEPFSFSKGGPYFGFDEDAPRLNEGIYHPFFLISETILKSEFGDILEEDVLQKLVKRHPGRWMPILEPRVSFQDTPRTKEAIRQDLARRLEVLERQIQSMPTQPESVDRHGIGGNHPPSDIDTPLPQLLLKADKAEALALISECRSSISDGAPAQDVSKVWEKLKPYLAQLGSFAKWLLGKVVDGAAKQVGSNFIQLLPKLVQMHNNGATISKLIAVLLGFD